MPSTRIALLAALGAFAPAPSAMADDYVPTFTPSTYWLHANGSQLGNYDAHGGNYLKWDATRPTGTDTNLYLGSNYSTVIAGDPDHTPTDFLTLQGKVKGDLDNLAFTLYFVG